MIDLIEKSILNTPVLGRVYRKRAAALKGWSCRTLNRFGMLRPYTFVQWLATNRCNFSCPYCETSSGKAKDEELTRQEVEALIDDLGAMGVRRLFISGGEPLVRDDIVPVMEYANRRGLCLGIATNGWRVAEFEKSFQKLKFFLFFTSLDGVPDYHDEIRGQENSFDRALHGFDLFSRMGVPVRILNTVIHPGNISQLERMVPYVKNSGVTSWRLSPVSSAGRASGKPGYVLSGEQLRYVAGFVEKQRHDVPVEFGHAHMYLGNFAGHSGGKPFFCGAGLTRCTIMQDGEVVGCHQIFDEKFSEGNIRTKPFSRIWKNGFTRFRRKTFPAACSGCAHFEACRGGCWAEMEKNGSCMKSVWYEGK